MSLGSDLKKIRSDNRLSLRDVERLAKENQLGAELSSGYLSMLERDEIREPSPRILHALSSIYEVDYIVLMKSAGYIPDDAKLANGPQPKFAFRGMGRLDPGQQERIQKFIDFELSETQKDERRSKE